MHKFYKFWPLRGILVTFTFRLASLDTTLISNIIFANADITDDSTTKVKLYLFKHLEAKSKLFENVFEAY